MSSTSSSASEGSPPTEATDLFDAHKRLRRQLAWLLPLGALPVLLAVVLLATYPTSSPLAGYRFQQVGWQAGRVWWVLAHRGSQAELLLSSAPSRGWQRLALHVDSAQAQALALNWGSRALLVGDSGTVRLYDSLLRPVPSTALAPLGAAFRGRWVAVDNTGQRAAIVGAGGQVFATTTGGRQWQLLRLPVAPAARPPLGPVVRAYFDDQGSRLFLVSARGYYVQAYPPRQGRATEGSAVAFSAKWLAARWPRPLALPIVWLGLDTDGQLLALDQQGTWMTQDRLDSISAKLPRGLLASAGPDSAGEYVGISQTQVFRGPVAKVLRLRAAPAAGRPGAKRPKQPSTLASKKSPPKRNAPTPPTTAKKRVLPAPRLAQPVDSTPKKTVPSSPQQQTPPKEQPQQQVTQSPVQASPNSPQQPVQSPQQAPSKAKMQKPFKY